MARAKMKYLEMPVQVVSEIKEVEVVTEILVSDVLPIAPIKPVKNYDFSLVVNNPFGRNQKGKMIVGDENIQAVIDAGHLPNCRKIKR